MGYTHYFSQTKSVAPDIGAKISRDEQVIINEQIQAGVALQSNHQSDKMIGKDYINFLGYPFKRSNGDIYTF